MAMTITVVAIRLDLPPPLTPEQSVWNPNSNSGLDPDSEPWVRLYIAEVPMAHGLATHPWFLVHDGGGPYATQRWEVWQTAVGPHGHVAVDLLAPEADVEGGPARLVATYQGAEAKRLIAVLRDRAPRYACADFYRVWPGPNSNSFARWVLDEAEIDQRLPLSSIGANWPCRR